MAKVKLVYLYLCRASDVEKKEKGKPETPPAAAAAASSGSPVFTNYAVRWDSRSKSQSDASLLLTADAKVRVGARPGPKLQIKDEQPGQDTWMLTITTPKRSLDVVCNSQEEFEHWIEVLAFICKSVGAEFVDQYTKANSPASK
jgi:hypothetical protein